MEICLIVSTMMRFMFDEMLADNSSFVTRQTCRLTMVHAVVNANETQYKIFKWNSKQPF